VSQGDIESLGYLASIFATGFGCKSKKEKALELYTQLAEAGRRNTQCFLAVCYQKGEIVPHKNIKLALYWYRKALLDVPEDYLFPTRLHPPALREEVMNIVRRLTTCAQCDDGEGEKFICAQCEFLCYCNSKCQALHWKAQHKMDCNKPVMVMRKNLILNLID
jgi:hypothetical protein